jgi:3-phenylpropionate/trans-cinnamate dioxygenase ferredoxin reductase subunit
MVGFAADGHTRIQRGSMSDRKFAVFYLDGERLVAVDAVNDPQSFMVGKRLFGQAVDSKLLEDAATDLRLLLKQA